MVALKQDSDLADALGRLATALENLDLGAETAPGPAPNDLSTVRADRNRLLAMLRSYLIPRVDGEAMPTTVIFAGPTGSGKSTLINSLVHQDLSPAGVVRPTTTSPVALASPQWSTFCESIGGISCDVTTGHAPVLETMVLVDTPDIDSTSVEHRAIAETLIDHADVVVFVTSALRYADSVPWQVLRRATERGTHVIHVLNRVRSSTSGAVSDFRARLRSAHMIGRPITVPEHLIEDDAQRIPTVAVRSLARRLAAVALERHEFSRDTFNRVTNAVLAQVRDLATDIDDLISARQEIEPEIALHLADRVGMLDLRSVGENVLVAPLPERTGRAERRWIRAHRLDLIEVAKVESGVVDRIRAAVHGDLRHWLSDERSLSMGEPAHLIDEIEPMLDSAATGWILYVRRMADELDDTNPWLAEAVLIEAATFDQTTAASHKLFGDSAGVLVDRARRELIGRLEVVYDQFGERVVGQYHAGLGELRDSDLRSALGAVNASFAAVHA